jgi:hypothetical protein
MRRSTLATSLCLIACLAFVGCDDDEDDNTETFTATLNGANEVPANGSAATGTATITRDGNNLTFDIQVNNITAVVAAHIHSGAAGVNGPIRVTLFSGPTTGTLTGRLVQGSATSTDVTGITYEQLLAEMNSNGAYVNVHTTAIPTGEIRGQLVKQ